MAQNRESSRRLTVAFTCARRQGLGDLLDSVRVSDPGHGRESARPPASS